MGLQNLKNNPGARKKTARRGRGCGSGTGGTAGRGHKGQRARTSGNVRPGFEGGQMPITRRIPKRGFNNKNFKTVFEVVNLRQLDVFKEGASVSPAELLEKGLIGKSNSKVKILGDGEIKKALNVKAHAFSGSAAKKIEESKGKVEIIRTIRK
ncbi:MAG: 50S ribosomal protein L15 [bacterium]|nr:50S ribosomal protein L15 [bacterium]